MRKRLGIIGTVKQNTNAQIFRFNQRTLQNAHFQSFVGFKI